MDSTVTSAALNRAVGSNVTAIDSSTGGAVLLNSTQMTDDVDNNTVVLSGVLWVAALCVFESPHWAYDTACAAAWCGLLGTHEVLHRLWSYRGSIVGSPCSNSGMLMAP